MSVNGKKLVSGVKELILAEGNTLEDLHMVAAAVVSAVDRAAERAAKKLKVGQKVRYYLETSGKEYGVRGADSVGFYRGPVEAQAQGLKIKVVDAESGKDVTLVVRDGLLEVFEEFDPQSSLGKKQSDVPKRRGRKPKNFNIDTHELGELAVGTWEREEEGEEYAFTDAEEYEYFNND